MNMIDVLITFGQSNDRAEGTRNFGAPSGWAADTLTAIWNPGTQLWEQYAPGVNSDAFGQLALGEPYNPGGQCWGIELPFAQRWRQRFPSRRLQVFKRAYGSTGIAEVPGSAASQRDYNPYSIGDQFDWCINDLNNAFSPLIAGGYYPNVIGVVFVGCETDTLTQAAAAACPDNLIALRSAIRRFWPLCAQAPFIAVRVLDSTNWPYRADVRAGIEQLANFPGCRWVSTDDFAHEHYIASEVLTLGNRIFDAWLDVRI